MRHDRLCKVCGKPSGKRNVCLPCKTRYPYRANTPAAKGGQSGHPPFCRRKMFLKENKNAG